MSETRVAIIGLGEAGSFFAQSLGGYTRTGFDILIEHPGSAKRLRQRLADIDITLKDSTATAVEDAQLIISTVTASETLKAARAASPGLSAGQIFVDLNSTSPGMKRQAADHVCPTNATYVDAVAMDTIARRGMETPILLSGENSAIAASLMSALGFRVTDIGGEIGTASTVKLLRSIVVKGLEALLAEMALGAAKAGVLERVLGSLQETYPGMPWDETLNYHVQRLVVHGRRRASEMRASADVLRDLGVDAIMAQAIADRQQWSADLELARLVDHETTMSVQDFVELVGRAAKR